MAISFTRAPEVAVGDPITSTQLRLQAQAFNDRLISGIGDGPWRIVFWFLNLFRQVRNHADQFVTAPPQEFFDIYQHVLPEHLRWPLSFPGDPGGANLVNPMMAYVFGSSPINAESETERYSNLVFLKNPPNEKDAWEHAKQQRGGVDPQTGVVVSPSFLVARSHFFIRYNPRVSQHGMSYGGFLPSPNDLGTCVQDIPSPDFPPAHSFLVRFTKLAPTLTIEEDKAYLVTGDTAVQYNGETYGPGQSFTGVEGVSVFLVPNPEFDPDDPEETDPEFILPEPGERTIHETYEFPGTCPPSSNTANPGEPYIGHVASITYQPEAYYVYTNQLDAGTGIVSGQHTHTFLTNVWLEGLYSGNAVLRKTDGGHIQRSLWNFLREFRGSISQRDDQHHHLDHAFDFHRLFKTQYHLAPGKGTQVAAPPGETEVNVLYPKWEQNDDAEAGEPVGEPYTYEPGFVLASAFLEADKLEDPVTVELLEGASVKATISLVPDETGKAVRLWMADTIGETGWVPAQPISWRLQSPLVFADDPAKFLKIEATELFPYKPMIQDAAMLVRGMSCIASQPDGTGEHETVADEHSQNYFRYGCLINLAGIPGIEDPLDNSVNWNAVYEAARRWSKLVRCPMRQQFVGYEVTGGKSILYFKRHAYGLSNETPADTFDGIAPARERLTNGDVRGAYEYIVRKGEITYPSTGSGQDPVTYTEGERFTGIFGMGGWIEGDEDELAEVFEANGIRLTAPPQDFTNEFLLGVELSAYDPDSVVFNVEDYTDQMVPLLQRCHFYSPEVAEDRQLLNHASYGQRVSGGGPASSGVLSPEIPSGWNYSQLGPNLLNRPNANEMVCDESDEPCKELRRRFYRSCRVYEPDIELEKCEVLIEGAEEIVKVTLKSRLHHCAEAPASIPRDRSSWDIGALQSETYRSHENGLREYLHNQDTGGTTEGSVHCTRDQMGNRSANSLVLETQTLEGTCYPKIRLVKLVPKPHDDANDTQDFVDTKFLHDAHAQMELYLRIMCEGYVDGITSAELACRYDTLSVYDFSYESLCFQAFENRWMPGFTPEDYPQNTQTFGPIPNTIARAYVFNCLSKAVNLLTSARVMLPAIIESRRGDGEAFSSIAGISGGGLGGGGECSGPLSSTQVYAQHEGGVAPITEYGEWLPAGGGGGAGSSIFFTGNCVGEEHEVSIASYNVEFRWRLVDPDAHLALQESWGELLATNASVLARRSMTSDVITGYTTTLDIDAAEQCQRTEQSPNWAFMAPNGEYIVWTHQLGEEAGCSFLGSTYEPPPVPGSYLGRVRRPDGHECAWGGSISVNISIISAITPMVTIPLSG